MENDVLYNRIMNKIHEEYGPPVNIAEEQSEEPEENGGEADGE